MSKVVAYLSLPLTGESIVRDGAFWIGMAGTPTRSQALTEKGAMMSKDDVQKTGGEDVVQPAAMANGPSPEGWEHPDDVGAGPSEAFIKAAQGKIDAGGGDGNDPAWLMDADQANGEKEVAAAETTAAEEPAKTVELDDSDVDEADEVEVEAADDDTAEATETPELPDELYERAIRAGYTRKELDGASAAILERAVTAIETSTTASKAQAEQTETPEPKTEPAKSVVDSFLETEEGKDLDPKLVAALKAVESGYDQRIANLNQAMAQQQQQAVNLAIKAELDVLGGDSFGTGTSVSEDQQANRQKVTDKAAILASGYANADPHWIANNPDWMAKVIGEAAKLEIPQAAAKATKGTRQKPSADKTKKRTGSALTRPDGQKDMGGDKGEDAAIGRLAARMNDLIENPDLAQGLAE